MSTLSAVHTFQVKSKDAVVNADKGTIHGVSMITGDLEAKGHGLQVDKTTLKQIYECAVGMGKVPVKTNHGSGVDAVNGYLCNFRIDGDKVRGDWVLLKSYPTTPHLMEMAEKMPESVGLSVAFRGDPELADGTAVYFDAELKQHYTLKGGQRQAVVAGTKLFARCTELVSTDLVASPAANPEGMFSARGVDSGTESMAHPSTSPVEIPAADAQMPAWAQALSDKLDSINDRIEAIEAGAGDDDDGLSEEEIQAGLEDGTLIDNGDGTFSQAEQAEDAGEGEGEESGEGEAEGGEAAEGVPAEAAAALQRGDILTALQVISIHATEQAFAVREAAAAKQQEQAALNSLQAKAAQLNEFATQAQTRIEALQAENAELRKFASAKGKTSAGAETFFAAKPQGGGGQITTFEQATAHYATEFAKAAPAESKASVQARAVEFAAKHHSDLYEAWQVARGIRPRRA